MFTEERALWIYDHYLWLEKALPLRAAKPAKVLITPGKEFFPDHWRGTHESALAVFDRMRAIMEIADWPCSLYQKPSIPVPIGIGSSQSKDAAGTFAGKNEQEVLISYSAGLLKEPVSYVATIAHELCHYLLAKVTTEPPCTWKELEPLTDLASVVEGFGVFAANSHFNFRGWTDVGTQGWSAKKIGYLNEAELGFSLAIFCVRNGIEPKSTAKLLKLNPREVFLDALGYVADLEEERRGAR
jgi:hypothetical protein